MSTAGFIAASLNKQGSRQATSVLFLFVMAKPNQKNKIKGRTWTDFTASERKTHTGNRLNIFFVHEQFLHQGEKHTHLQCASDYVVIHVWKRAKGYAPLVSEQNNNHTS